MANDMTFGQISAVLNSLQKQATGQIIGEVTDTASFVSVAQTLLKTGYDPVLSAISQVLSRTIFSIRPYTSKFAGLQVSNQQYGNHVRKINFLDRPFENDARNTLADGQSVDQYKVNKPLVLQTNFYGAEQFQKTLTIFRDQLDCAFSGPDEFQRFITGIMTNASDMIEQAHESVARATVCNLIGGTVKGAADSVIHLLTEYNNLTGLELTAQTVYTPENYSAFIQWAYSRVASVSDLMTERTMKFQINVNDKPIMRHTPYARQRVYLYAPEKRMIESRVLADAFHDNYLSLAANELVNFWQSLDKPDTINVKASYLDATTGGVKTDTAGTATEKVWGVIMDEEAAGYTVVNQWSASTPFNAVGGYSNMVWHFTDRWWNDNTEKVAVFLLD